MGNAYIHKRSAGITLPELLVAMVLVGILMTATFYVFSSFFSASLSQERRTLSTADAQIGGQFLKWDIFMTGYGIPIDSMPISLQDNVGENGSDILTLISIAFGPTGNSGKWTYVISPIGGSNQMLVRRWNDPQHDVQIGEYVTFLSPTRTRIGLPYYRITNRQSASGPSGQDAWLLTMSSPVNSSNNFIFVLGDTISATTTTYYVQNGNLMRNKSVFIEGVADFQVAFWVDIDGDRNEDVGEIFNNLPTLLASPGILSQIRLIRLSILTAAKATENYYYPDQTITIENHNFDVEQFGRNYRYDIQRNIMNPRNLD